MADMGRPTLKQIELLDGEIWKDLDCLKGIYAVSNMGRVCNKKTNRLITPTKQTRGYMYVSLWLDNKCVCLRLHKLVAMAFVENPDPEHKKEVHHKDGNKINCVADNLQWVTRSENMREYFKTHKGRTPTPEERARTSARLKGRHLSAETKAKLSEANKGKKHPNRKKPAPFTPEHRKHLSEAQRGRRHSAETKAKMREARKNVVITEEWRNNMSKALKGRHLSAYHIARIKEGRAQKKAERESKLYVKSLFD